MDLVRINRPKALKMFANHPKQIKVTLLLPFLLEEKWWGNKVLILTFVFCMGADGCCGRIAAR